MTTYNPPNSSQPSNQGSQSTMLPSSHQDFLDISTMPLEKDQHTLMWQQNQFLTDSGIQSAFETHAPSISSKHGLDEMEHSDIFMGAPPQYKTQHPQTPYQSTQQHWSNQQLMSVYPPSDVLMSPGTPGESSCILGGEGMAEQGSGAMMSCGGNPESSNCSSKYFPDTDAADAANAIPEIVKVIKDEEDQWVINQTSVIINQMSKSEAIDSIIASTDLVECIVSVLGRTQDPESSRYLSGVMYCMGQKPSGLQVMLKCGCIPILVSLLDSNVDTIVNYAITTLHNLLLYQPGAKDVMRESNCAKRMTALLHKNNLKFLAVCTDCLLNLAYGDPKTKLAMLDCGGPKALLNILVTYREYEKLLWTTARVLKVLSVCPLNKKVMIEVGCVEELTNHLQSSSSRLVHNCLLTIRNLSDALITRDSLEPLLLQSIKLLQNTTDPNMATCVVGILGNLTSNNNKNKMLVYKFGGVEALVKTLYQAGDNMNILEPCLCTLRHITSRHDEAENVQRCVGHSQGIPLVIRLLQQHQQVLLAGHQGPPGAQGDRDKGPGDLASGTWSLVKPMVILLRNLANCSDNHQVMREGGLIATLGSLLTHMQYEISARQQQSNSQGQPTSTTLVEGVRLEELVEAACSCLHQLAHESYTRLTLLRGGQSGSLANKPLPRCGGGPDMGGAGVAVFVELLFSPHETIQRAAAGVLFELVQENEGLNALISMPNALHKLNVLTSSKSEALSTYAMTIMLRISEHWKDPGVSSGPPHSQHGPSHTQHHMQSSNPHTSQPQQQPHPSQQPPQRAYHHSPMYPSHMQPGPASHQHPSHHPQHGHPPPPQPHQMGGPSNHVMTSQQQHAPPINHMSQQHVAQSSPAQHQSLSAMLGPPPDVMTSQSHYMHHQQQSHYQDSNGYGGYWQSQNSMDHSQPPHHHFPQSGGPVGINSMATNGFVSPGGQGQADDPMMGGDFMAILSPTPPPTNWYSGN